MPNNSSGGDGHGHRSPCYNSNISALASLRLCGREGYSVWKFKMRNYLLHEDLWETVDGYPEGDTISTETKLHNDRKALSKICLTLDGPAITHVRSSKTAKEAWDALKIAYEDRGMGRRLALERRLYRLNLIDFDNVESYINAVLSTAQDLADIGKQIEDASIAAILLGGLTVRYEPLIMGLENSNIQITSEMVKTKLLNEICRDVRDEPDTALKTGTRSKTNMKKPIVCYDCNEPGHKRPDCPHKKGKSKDKKFKDSTLFSVQDLAFGENRTQMDNWVIDSGATRHMTSRSDWFSSIKPYTSGKVTIANGEDIDCTGIGNVSVSTLKKRIKTISDVAYVPDLKANLLSISKIVDKGYTVIFDKTGCNIYDSDNFKCITGESILRGSMSGGLYILDCTIDIPQKLTCNVTRDDGNTSNTGDAISQYQLWHRRLGHLCRFAMRSLKNQGIINFNHIDKLPCVSCIEAKQSRKSFKSFSTSRATEPLGLVYADLCGPMSEVSLQGNKYMLLFIDDFSRSIFAYFISSKVDVKAKFVAFQAIVEKQTNCSIKMLRTDNGTEFVNKELSDYLASQGIQHQTTAPYSPQQVGVAERSNRTIVEKARALLADSSLSKAYWQDACEVAVYLKNRSPHHALDFKTPYEIWYGVKPNINHIRVFGCRALVHIPACSRKKLDVKAEEQIFIGYSEDPNTYYFRNACYPRRLIKSRDVTFFENRFSSLKNNIENCISVVPPVPLVLSGSKQDQIEATVEVTADVEDFEDAECQDGVTLENVSQSIQPSVEDCEDVVLERRYPARNRNQPDFLSYQACISSAEPDEPRTYKEAINAVDAHMWKEAMADEYYSLRRLKTWDLVPRFNKKAIPCKWVFKIKRDAQGNIAKYKARLVAKGFKQVANLDYFETFSPVVRISSLRTLFALSVQLGLKMHHLDVDTAFLNAELEEEVFMEQPPGFTVNTEQVCLLRKSIYGLKQAARAWNSKLDETLSSIGFTKTPSDHCVYTKLLETELIILAIYVDDIIIFYKNNKSFDTVKNDLEKSYKIKDLGPLKYYLGINVFQTKDCIKINQQTYIKSILAKYNMQDCKPVSTPLANTKLAEDTSGKDCEQCPYPYQELIGSLMFLAVNTRPDIAFACSYLSQFNSKFNKSHWQAAKRVIQYLKGTSNLCITYRKNEKYLQGYTDADWANCTETRRSYTGFYVKLADGPVSWQCKKQPTVALSSAEAEYMSMAMATKEACYLSRFLGEVTGESRSHCVTFFSDSQAAMKLASNPVHHSRTKHIDTRYHFIREKVLDKVVAFQYTPTESNWADVLTKALGRIKHNNCVANLLCT